MLLLLAIACGSPSEESGDPWPDPHTDTVDTAPEPPRDLDRDGHTDEVDCDDLDPDVHPGAEEVWNLEDDDCDGRRDADGQFAGTTVVTARVTYEGEPHTFVLDCPTTLQRSANSVQLLVACDPEEEDAEKLLGETFTVEEIDNQASEGAFSGEVEVRSSDGWDTSGTGTLAWDGFDEVALTVAVSSTFLTMSGSGAVALE